MDYALIAALIVLFLCYLAAAAAMGYLIYEALTTMGEIQTRRSQLMIMLAKNIIEQKSVKDQRRTGHADNQKRENHRSTAII